MNRNERRRAAALIARDFGVTQEDALAALTRALERLLAANWEPQVMQITREALQGFPSYDPTLDVEDSKAWLAVGIDVAGCGTFAVESIVILGNDISPREEKLIAQERMLLTLQKHLCHAGVQA